MRFFKSGKDLQVNFKAKERSSLWTKRNGRVIWSEKAYEGVPRAKRHVKATQANSIPVTDGRYVVALFGSARI